MNLYRLMIDGHAVAVIRPENRRCVRRLANQLAAALGGRVRIAFGEIELATVVPSDAPATRGAARESSKEKPWPQKVHYPTRIPPIPRPKLDVDGR